MFFKDFTGHIKQKELVRQLVDRNNVPHAQIIFGSEGVGKLPFVRALCSYLLCTDKLSGDSCGQCAACIKSHKMIHPDIHFTFPTVGTNVTSNQMIKSWRNQQLENPFMVYTD